MEQYKGKKLSKEAGLTAYEENVLLSPFPINGWENLLYTEVYNEGSGKIRKDQMGTRKKIHSKRIRIRME